ncbi:hypothetical protein [Microbacterium suaedae]|uniref:hypothetical protein n=1 Tax=Microbacterium suaedae TaxID=2067813 RepID=UPI000DA147A5|nr:hypothetical protein [Microbacterium suaedae]
MHDFLAVPARRDVQGMKATLGAMEEGEPVHAILRTNRYGDVELSSAAHVGIGGDMMIAGRIVAGPLTKTKDGEPARTPTSDLRVVRDGVPSPRGETIEATDLSHGDLVSVDFTAVPYGEISVSGIATEGADGYLLVGEWIIRLPEEQAPAVERVRLIARDGEHSIPVPDRRPHYQSDIL